jgi:hypothetical protein
MGYTTPVDTTGMDKGRRSGLATKKWSALVHVQLPSQSRLAQGKILIHAAHRTFLPMRRDADGAAQVS